MTAQHEMIQDLQRPSAYPWQPPQVTMIETHLSWVFLAGGYVVKIKRPVAYPFVDYTSLARRHRSCEDEIRLNRRLTDGVYLGVVPITRDAAGYRVNGPGPAVEWATLMRRLPEAGMLDQLLATGPAPNDLATRLAARLIPFHRDVAVNCGGAAHGTVESQAQVLTDNLDELRDFVPTLLASGQLALVDTAIRTFLAEGHDQLARRVAEGWVREGHGDLRAEHICLEPDGRLQVFDCIEFNPALRCADVASDLAFLLMDLDRLGADPVAAELIGHYRAAGIPLPPVLLNLYRAHRALVRAKVTGLTLKAGLESAEATATARRYLDLATSTALSVRPALIAMTGLSGTGKTTVAQRLGTALDIPIVASDVVRKNLAGITGLTPDPLLLWVYSEEMTEATYRGVMEQADQVLASGRAVIMDAAFLEQERREEAATLAARHGVPLIFIETVCPVPVAEDRLVRRRADGTSLSDADVTVYRGQQSMVATAPPFFPPSAMVLRVDTISPKVTQLDPVLAALHRSGTVIARIPEQDRPAATVVAGSNLAHSGAADRVVALV